MTDACPRRHTILCCRVWMDENICPRNCLNDRPGIRHACRREMKHIGPCTCDCGAQHQDRDGQT